MLFVFKNIKKYCLEYTKMKIGTHDGRFHCDQVLACVMLRNYTEKFKNATIIRTRDPALLQSCDIVVDVGGKYQPPFKLDHHQIQFQHTYPQHNIRLSSAGLVYLHYGQQVIKNLTNQIILKQKQNLTFQPLINQQIIKMIQEKIYKSFIIYVDANDNGIGKIDQKEIAGGCTTLWNRIGRINPMWWEENTNQFELFKRAMEIADEELFQQVRSHILGSIQTKGIVKEAFLKRKQVHPSGKVILVQKYVPWVKPLFQLQQQEKCVNQVLYVVFPQKSGNKWRIQAVPANEGSFDLRKGLKTEWRGIKDIQKLINISGIPDINFVHATGFIGGAVSKESTLKMAQLSM